MCEDCGDVKAKLGLCGLCGLCMGPASTPIGDNVTFTANFVLGPADAVAWFGCTPPPSEYFGWDLIINARLIYPGTNFGNALSFRRTNTSAATATDDTDGTDGTDDTAATAAPFAQPALVVHTADGAAAAAVAGAFAAAPEDGGGGVAPEAVSTHALDAREIKFMNFSEADDWRSAGPDLLSMVFRATLPLDGHEDAFDRYQAAVFPVRLFVGAAGAAAGEALTPDVFPRETTAATTAGAASPPPRPSPPLSAAARSFKGQQELPTEAALLGGTLDALAAAVKAAFLAGTQSQHNQTNRNQNQLPNASYAGETAGEQTPFGYYDDWDQVLAARGNDTFVAPTRDCTYTLGIPESAFAPNALGPGLKGAGVLIGVVHTAANGTHANGVAYSSAGVSLYDGTGCDNVLACPSYRRNNQRQTSWLNHRQLLGSAARYFSSSSSDYDDDEAYDQALVAQLFAMDFLPAGGCSSAAYAPLHSDWCFEYSEEALRRFPNVPPLTDPPLLPAIPGRHDVLPVLGERIYSQTATDTGPANGEVLPARLLHFTFVD